MGDIYEYVSWPYEYGHFMEITSSGMTFEVKAADKAYIEISEDRSPDNVSAVLLSENAILLKNKGFKKQVTVENLISEVEYRSFWLRWNGGIVRIGRKEDHLPLISLKMANPAYLSYVMLRCGGNQPVYWRTIVSPLWDARALRPLTSGQLNWERREPGIPLSNEAMIGGIEEELFYIIRAEHEGTLTPGKYGRFKDAATISWNGEEIKKTDYEILCGCYAIWEHTSDDEIPDGAFVAGHTENKVESLYIGRVDLDGNLILGKVQASKKACFIYYEGKELACRDYEILVIPDEEFKW